MVWLASGGLDLLHPLSLLPRGQVVPATGKHPAFHIDLFVHTLQPWQMATEDGTHTQPLVPSSSHSQGRVGSQQRPQETAESTESAPAGNLQENSPSIR